MKANWRRLSPPAYKAALSQAWDRTLRSGAWAGGRNVGRLEARIADHLEVAPEQVVATINCSSALAVAVRLLGDREITCPVLTYAGTWTSVPQQQLTLVDTNDKGWANGPVTIGVDLWGRPCPSPCVILDAAHNYGHRSHLVAMDNGTRFVCYSFGPLKEIPCLVGGALVCASAAEAQAARFYLNHGINPKTKRPEMSWGIKGYMPNAAATWIMRQMDRADELRAGRQNVLGWYYDTFRDRMLTRPDEASGHLAVLKCDSPGHRQLVADALTRVNCEWSIHYQLPWNTASDCPVATELSKRIISIPCHHKMRRADVIKVARVVIGA
jgi:dTDP-4-amino-4,6-dideoxygalactose transaminase